MAGMRAVHKKNGTTFKYSGDLKETIEKAEKELKEKEGTTQWLFLKWQYDNARKAFEKYNRRLKDLKDDLIRTPMRNLQEFLEDDASVPDVYDVTQPSVLACIGEKGIRRATVITDCAYTITTRQDRTPAQVIDRGGGRYRYLTERECWRLMGYTDEDFDRAKAVQERNGKYYKALYDQAGNSIAVPIFESIFRKIILHEVA